MHAATGRSAMMKYVAFLALMPFAVGGCAARQAPPTSNINDPKLTHYIERYCNSTGNMGIGFSGGDTYDYAYRQRLKASKDTELLRLFVLSNLYQDVDHSIYELSQRNTGTGKNQSRPMTPAEQRAELSRITAELDDLARFDPGDPNKFIAGDREELLHAAAEAK